MPTTAVFQHIMFAKMHIIHYSKSVVILACKCVLMVPS